MIGPREEFAALLRASGVEPGLHDPLVRYLELLERWSAVHSLVRFASRRELVERHVLDALAGVERLGERGRLADLGSGAGLPGVPLLVARPGWSGLLVEPRTKRWAFLRMVVRELALDCEVAGCRFEEIGRERGPFDAVTARALGRAPEVLAWARERLAPGGAVLLWTTTDGVEVLRREAGWRVVSSPLPRSDRGRLAQIQPCFT